MAARVWPIDELPLGTPLPSRLYALGQGLYLEAGSRLTPALLESFRTMGVTGFSEAPIEPPTEYFQHRPTPRTPPKQALPTLYVPQLLQAALPERLLPSRTEAEALAILRPLYESTMAPLQAATLAPLIEAILNHVGSMAGPPVLSPRPLKSSGFLAAHALDTALIAAWLGIALGYDRAALEALLTATLLRDVGETAYPPDLLARPKPFTASEKAQLEDHPLRTASWLTRNAVIDEEVHRTVRQHHERFDGRGYPLRLPGRQLATSAQVLALADTYVAVTSPRPHRHGATLQRGVQTIVQGAGAAFEPRFAAMIGQRLGTYPTGSVVWLGGQRPAVVIAGGGVHRWQPVVRLVTKMNGTVELGDAIDLRNADEKVIEVVR